MGPILFLIYINDLPDKTRSKVFTDGTAMYLAVSNLQDAQILQQDLDHLHELELLWDMEFKPNKCVVIHITRARTPAPTKYLLHGKSSNQKLQGEYRNQQQPGSEVINVFPCSTQLSMKF